MSNTQEQVVMTKDGLKFKYFQEHKRQLAREKRVWKELYSIDPKL
jgi:hypothetical protein